MKKYLLTIAILINGLITFAQTPTSFQYQAVLRDATGQVLATQDVEIGIAILQGSTSGVEVFTETHFITTNNFGLANLQIGSVNPAGMEAMDWSSGPYFVQVSVDGTVMGTSQLLSVPFAMHAVTVENDAVDDADADPTNEIQDISLSGNELSISSGSTLVLPDEVNDADADPTNELQVLSIKGDTIFLSDGGYALLPAETDPQFSAWDKSTGVTISESQISDLQHFTNSDETDPVFESSLANQITANDTARWGNDTNPTNELQVLSIKGDTIFLTKGGFALLPAETDPQFAAWDKSSGVTISESQISDLKHFTNENETDPVFESSLAKQITASDTTRWAMDVDPTNELQVLSIKGDTIFLTNGGFVKLPAETDPMFSAWDKSTGVTISESQITDLQHFTNSDETDPVFEQSLAKQITISDTARWGIDADPTNELQDINLNGTDLSISDGSTVDLSVIQDGTGTDKQLLGWQVNNQGDIKLHISNGNSVTLPFIREEEDGDPSNELNTSVTLNGTDLEVTDAGGTITTDLSSLINDADADPLNEIQNINEVLTQGNNAEGRNLVNLGNVGIGNSNPVSELHITSPTEGQPLTIEGNGGYTGISLIRSGKKYVINNTAQREGLGIWDTDSSQYRLLIDSIGRVGIGTRSPDYKLEVIGSIRSSLNIFSGNLYTRFGGSTTYRLRQVGSSYVGYVTSDRRLKENIQTISDPFDKIQLLRGVIFNWNQTAKDYFIKDVKEDVIPDESLSDAEKEAVWHEEEQKILDEADRKTMSFIAQEVETNFPQWVKENDDGYKEIDMKGLNSLLVEAIKKLITENNEIKQRLQNLETLVQNMLD